MADPESRPVTQAIIIITGSQPCPTLAVPTPRRVSQSQFIGSYYLHTFTSATTTISGDKR